MTDSLHRPAVSSRLFGHLDVRVAPLFCLLLLTAACVLAALHLPAPLRSQHSRLWLPRCCRSPPHCRSFSLLGSSTRPSGFAVLRYPVDANTLLWGLAIGVAALAATAVSAQVLRLLPATGRAAALALALIAAYAAYEIVLLAFATVLGGAGTFTIAIIARLGLLNIAWMIGLSTVWEGWRAINIQRKRFGA